jgi:hypothetical protein
MATSTNTAVSRPSQRPRPSLDDLRIGVGRLRRAADMAGEQTVGYFLDLSLHAIRQRMAENLRDGRAGR